MIMIMTNIYPMPLIPSRLLTSSPLYSHPLHVRHLSPLYPPPCMFRSFPLLYLHPLHGRIGHFPNSLLYSLYSQVVFLLACSDHGTVCVCIHTMYIRDFYERMDLMDFFLLSRCLLVCSAKLLVWQLQMTLTEAPALWTRNVFVQALPPIHPRDGCDLVFIHCALTSN